LRIKEHETRLFLHEHKHDDDDDDDGTEMHGQQNLKFEKY